MANRALTRRQILSQIPRARARERQEARDGFRANSARYQRSTERLILELTNGAMFAFPVRIVPALRNLSPTQLSRVALDGSGGGLRWDAQDIDLSVAGLILSIIGPIEQRRELARLAGSVTSRAKAAAARRNGQKGGRPRRSV